MFSTIICLFDCTGNTSNYFRDRGHEVIQIDSQLDLKNAVKLKYFESLKIEGLICYHPCTYFSKARKKPAEFDLDYGLSTLDLCFRLNYLYKPRVFIIENPFHSRIRKYIGKPKQIISLGSYGFQSEKLTGLWGDFKNLDIGYDLEYRRNKGKLDTLSTFHRSTTPLKFVEELYRSNFLN